MWKGFRNDSAGQRCLRIWGFNNESEGTYKAEEQWANMHLLTRGDLLIRYQNANWDSQKNHVAIVATAGKDKLTVYHCASESQDVTTTAYTPGRQLGYNYAVRPLPKGRTMVNSTNSSHTGGNFTPRAAP
jgi:hypothetical protein